MEDRLLSKLKAGQLAVGVFHRSAPHLITQIQEAGYDWFMNDRMHGGLDWAEAEHMVAQARASGVTPTMRINSMPWASSEPDRHLPAEVGRALSLGYTAAMWSYSAVEEVRQCVRMADDWHRGSHYVSGDELREAEKKYKDATLIIPMVESLEAINLMEDAMSVDGIKAFFISITDTSRVLGHPFNVEHPDVWRVVDQAVTIGKKKGIWIGVNTSYMFHDIESNIKRVKRLRDHGVDFVATQGLSFVFYWAAKAMMEGIRSEGGCA